VTTPLLIAAIVALMALGVPLAAVVGLAAVGCLLAFTRIPLQAVFQQLYQGAEYDLLQAVIFFIAAGSIMTRGSLAARLVRVGQALVGPYTGGMAVTAILICMLFAAVSGSSPATVVAVGTIMIPAMVKSGYSPRFSTGLLTSAGSLGIMIPPSIPMIIWAVVVGVSVTKQFAAGFIPGFVIGGALMAYSYFMARRRGWHTEARLSAAEIRSAFAEGAWSLFMPVIVLGGIYSGVFTATEAAAVSFVYALVVELCIHRTLAVKDLLPVCRQAAVTSAMLLFIIANASVLSYYFSVDQIPLRAADFLLQYIESRAMFLFLVNVALLVMGCFMDIVSAMLVLGPVFLPLLQKFGIDPIHFGIIMVLNIEIGFLTPPFGVNLFVASGVTGKGIGEIARSVAPFIILFLGLLALITYVPWFSLCLTPYVD
jgi:C4-dicarboxylate transporter DctM subunit